MTPDWFKSLQSHTVIATAHMNVQKCIKLLFFWPFFSCKTQPAHAALIKDAWMITKQEKARGYRSYITGTQSRRQTESLHSLYIHWLS